MRRSGRVFAWQHYGVRPDVMIVVRVLGSNLPVGAFLAQSKVVGTMVPGDHGTTYEGNPLVATGASAVLDLFEKRHMAEHVRKIGAYLAEKLGGLVGEFDVVKERRGMGLTQGLEFASSVGSVASDTLLEQRFAPISAGADIIRFVSPLVIRGGDTDEVILRLRQTIKALFQKKEMTREMLREENDLPRAFLFPLLLGCLK